MWCWRRMEKISCTDRVRNEEVLFRVNERGNILHEIRKRKANWIGHILCRNCLLKQVIEGKIKGEMEVTRSRGRRRKKQLDDLKDRRGYSHLKEEALDRTMLKHRIRGGFGPVVRQNTEWMNIYIYICVYIYIFIYIYIYIYIYIDLGFMLKLHTACMLIEDTQHYHLLSHFHTDVGLIVTYCTVTRWQRTYSILTNPATYLSMQGFCCPSPT